MNFSLCNLHLVCQFTAKPCYVFLFVIGSVFRFISYSRHLTFIQINYQPDATVFQFIILTFIYSSTCFGRVRGRAGQPAGPTTNTARLSPRYEGKTTGCQCSP